MSQGRLEPHRTSRGDMLNMGAKALHIWPGIDSRNERHTDSVNMVSDNVQERPDTRQHGRPCLCAGTWR